MTEITLGRRLMTIEVRRNKSVAAQGFCDLCGLVRLCGTFARGFVYEQVC